VTRLSSSAYLRLLLDDELVLDAKRSRHATRAHAGDRLSLSLSTTPRSVIVPCFTMTCRGSRRAAPCREPAGAHRVKAGAEPMPVAPQHASAGAYRDRNGSR